MKRDFKVGDWIVTPERFCIHLQGKTVHITPKSMGVLECLAKAGGEVVTRNDLLDTVWPGAAVTDDVLTHCVVELRQAFDDSAQDPQFIETIPKKGFRLMAEVRPVDDKRSKLKRAWGIALAIVAALAVGVASVWYLRDDQSSPVAPKTIAVFPFDSLTTNGDQGLFADGLTEEVIYHLTQLDGLSVIGRASSFALKGQIDDLQAVAEELAVSYVVDGSVRRVGGELRVTARLRNVSSGVVEWSANYDAQISDIFDIQQQIAGSVAEALSIGLGVGDFAAIEGGTRSIEAYEQYIAGNATLVGPDAEPLRAAKHLERATELDPNFALAWVGLAEACKLATLAYDNDAEGIVRFQERRDRAITKALSLAPNSERVLLELASIRILDGDYRDARLIIDRIHARYQGRDIPYSIPFLDLSLKMGRIGEARTALESIRIRDPLHPFIPNFLGHYYMILGRPDEALAERERGWEGGHMHTLLASDTLYEALATGRRAEIEEWLQRANAAMPDRYLYEQTPYDFMLENLDDRDTLLQFLGYLQATKPGWDPFTTQWAAYLGDDETALRSLQRLPDPWTMWSPLLKRVRQTDAFKQILIDTGIVDYWREFGWGDFCSPTEGDDFECR